MRTAVIDGTAPEPLLSAAVAARRSTTPDPGVSALPRTRSSWRAAPPHTAAGATPTPPWGGSLENRTAFPRRVIQAVREAVGPDFVVGIRMSLDEAQPGGPTFDEALTAAERYAADGIDFISAIHGSIESDASLAKAIPSIGTPLGPFPDFTGEIKRRLSVPRDARGAHRRRRHRAARSA